MIRVTVELISAHGPSRNRMLGVADIVNTGRGTKQRGIYLVRLSKAGKKVREQWKVAEVRDFPRLRLGAWDLLFRALRACVADRNPEERP